MFTKLFGVAPNANSFKNPSIVALSLAVLLLAAAVTHAGPPWRSPPVADRYNEPHPSTPPPAKVTHPPVRYTITVTVLPVTSPLHEAASEKGEAHIMAHLPATARLTLGDEPTLQEGTMRYFSSPPLTPGKKYTYTARVVWFEDGKWVSQTQKVPVWSGRTTCIYLSKPSAVTRALGELDADDRKLATAQKYCPVQPDNLLGSMGKPVKVMLKGKPVFLCCEGCLEQARSAPDKTLGKAKELGTKNTPMPKK
jgi:uncharacterized protein (TIGR03000 family)